MTFKRWCKRCGCLFQPISKYNRFCDECKLSEGRPIAKKGYKIKAYKVKDLFKGTLEDFEAY